MMDDFLAILGAIALIIATVLVLPFLFLAVLFRRMGGFYYHW